ncbi:hypothetical protein BXZ70DRAFT_921417 [Cristinia sonorae]|uniref:RING-type domain-containing protein n=1 Tax=Cristinia sonorae TaxID=1940300 RepID=A0A8K0UVG2_9AGAR|nr:hypothetical protein BXZ70DRAFT_921417 [Cristinia sonorae]
MSNRPRASSVTDAFRLRPGFNAIPREDNPILALAARSQAAHSRNTEFIESLPKLTEKDIATLELSDSSCPICIVPFSTILTEEEMALAMDSPAYALEDLGVTKLDQTCGHAFCRKDIRNWLLAGHNSCPTCRRALVVTTPDISEAPGRLSDLLQATQASMRDIESLQAAMQSMSERLDHLDVSLQAAGGSGNALQHGSPQSEPDRYRARHDAYDDDRSHFSGMYS